MILITRPAEWTNRFKKKLEALGCEVIPFPTLSILPPADPVPLDSAINFLDAFDAAIFISPSSVSEFLKKHRPLYFSEQCKIIALGEGTANCLERANIHVDLYPVIANTRHLLALPLFSNIQEKRVVIFAGEKGRTDLKETLEKQGAKIHMAYTHRRARPSYSPQEVTWQPDDVALSINLSLESLQNLRTILGEIHRLKLLEKPLLVVSEAMKEAAQQLGFSGAIIVAADATESSLINEVSRIFKI